MKMSQIMIEFPSGEQIKFSVPQSIRLDVAYLTAYLTAKHYSTSFVTLDGKRVER